MRLPALAAITLGLMTLGACSTTGPTDDGEPQQIVELPEGVLEIVDPSLDITDVRVMPEDGCYWYRHVGPVETTYLPLLTRQNRRICTEAAAEEAAAS